MAELSGTVVEIDVAKLINVARAETGPAIRPDYRIAYLQGSASRRPAAQVFSSNAADASRAGLSRTPSYSSHDPRFVPSDKHCNGQCGYDVEEEFGSRDVEHHLNLRFDCLRWRMWF
ncbi:hypothetical protein ACVW1B_001705 [Bradyrhizobium sp. USDA 4502]